GVARLAQIGLFVPGRAGLCGGAFLQPRFQPRLPAWENLPNMAGYFAARYFTYSPFHFTKLDFEQETRMTVEFSAPGLPPAQTLLRAKYLLFALIGVVYAYVLWTNENFLFDRTNPEWAHIAPFQLFLLPHGMAAACALFLGPLQFSDRLRRHYTTVH